MPREGMVAAPGQTGGPLGGQLEEGKRETKTLELPALSMTKALISRTDGWMREAGLYYSSIIQKSLKPYF